MYSNQSSESAGGLRNGPTVERSRSATMATRLGEVRVVVFTEPGASGEHVALVHGHVANQPDVPVCMRACMLRDEPGPNWDVEMQRALTLLENEERGVLVFLRQPGVFASEGPERVRNADERDYVIAADILRDLRVRSVRLMGAARH